MTQPYGRQKSPLRVAVIADVHGNPWALTAVIDDIATRDVDLTVNLGDNLLGPLDPLGAAEILMAQSMINVRGNGDRELVEPLDDAAQSASSRFTRPLLTARHLAWLSSLPTTRTVEDILCCHGIPTSDMVCLLEEINEDGTRQRTATDVATLLGDASAHVVVCGHSHVPRTVRLPDGRLVVNPGSVGLPAYSDDKPYPHIMESGTPHAKYALLSRDAAGWNAEHRSVAYDWERAAGVADEHDRPDWAFSLRTGRARVNAK